MMFIPDIKKMAFEKISKIIPSIDRTLFSLNRHLDIELKLLTQETRENQSKVADDVSAIPYLEFCINSFVSMSRW